MNRSLTIKALNSKMNAICCSATKGQVDTIINMLKPFINQLDYVFYYYVFNVTKFTFIEQNY